jgi:ketosteroid isomerase-like protein
VVRIVVDTRGGVQRAGNAAVRVRTGRLPTGGSRANVRPATRTGRDSLGFRCVVRDNGEQESDPMFQPAKKEYFMAAQLQLQALFDSIDEKNVDVFTGFMADDAVYRFGNAEPIVGKAAIAESVRGFFDSIKSLSHDVQGSWVAGDTVICHGTVTYTRLDGSTLTIPFADILAVRDGAISDYLIFADASELY